MLKARELRSSMSGEEYVTLVEDSSAASADHSEEEEAVEETKLELEQDLPDVLRLEEN